MTTLLHYHIIQLLYESVSSLVYRALRHSDHQTVVLKLLKENYCNPAELACYQQEYDIIHHLAQVEGVIQVYGLEKSQNIPLLILEDFGGQSLSQLYSKQVLHLTDFFTLAMAITTALGNLHGAEVIHKDINPSNIVYNPLTGQLKLIDFGIATRLPRENPILKNPHHLEGTLAYLSPEQTGRMNRSLDYRTDFYALGVTFYELLTGQLPFSSQDATELVHCHLAKQPLPPHQVNPTLPPLLSEIVLKLMAKAAEERYQSAWGLQQDLETCQRQMIQRGCIETFSLGQHDLSDHLHLPQKLYGREEALRPLLSAFEHVTQGQSQLLLVAGYSGIGKSSLIQEIYKPITEKRGYFIAGKFDQFQRNIPYSAVVQAFRDLVRQLLTETPSQVEGWRTKILTAVGSNGQVITEVIPEMELLLGKQTAVSLLSPSESQNRFNLVFWNFIKVFCQPYHPLVLFLDDLQWIDSASLKLMTLMMNDIPYLLLIGAYRDNEVHPTHPLANTLDEMQKQGILVQVLTLTPLTLSHINQFVSETLHLPHSQTFPLAELILDKTGGNPFFMGEFLKALYTEKLLEFNVLKREWQWNLTQIRARNITDNVVILMTNKIQQFTEATQRVLTLAAAMGNQFDLATLAMVSQQSEEQVKIQLWEALVEGCVVPREEKYKFVHDQVQQAAYSLISETARPMLHWTIGQLLLNHLDSVEESLFKIVDHLNKGLDLAETPMQRHHLASLNLHVGKRAKLATAYQVAQSYLQTGLMLLMKTADHWKTEYTLSLGLYEQATEVAYLNHEFDIMEAYAQVILQHAHTVLDMVKSYESMIYAYGSSQYRFEKTLETGLQVLSLLGVNFPKSPTQQNITQALARTQILLSGKSTEELLSLPPMEEPSKIAALQIMTNLAPAVYQFHPLLLPLLACEQVIQTLQYGNAPCSAAGFADYAILLCGTENFEEAYQIAQIALHFAAQDQARENKGKVLFKVALFTQYSKRHAKDILPLFREGSQCCMETGDIEHLGYNIMGLCQYMGLTSPSLETIAQEMLRQYQLLVKLKLDVPCDYVRIYYQIVLNLQGQTETPSHLNGKILNEEALMHHLKIVNNKTTLCVLYIYKFILAYWFSDPQVLSNAQQAKDYLEAIPGQIFLTTLFYFYDSLTQLKWAESSLSSTLEGKEIWRERVLNNQQVLQTLAHQTPVNFQHKYDLVEAEKARVLGQKWEAAKFYEKAMLGAKESEYLQEEALAYELAAEFYLAEGMKETTQIYLTKAYQAYQHWGAQAKVKQLEQKYFPLFVQKTSSSMRTITTAISTATGLFSSTQSATVLDVHSLIKFSQTLLGERNLEKLLHQMMSLVIENAGAQTGFLLLPEEQDQWFIQAHVDQEGIEVLQALSFTQTSPLASSVIQYVCRTHQSVILDSAAHQGHFTRDPYIVEQQTQSLLCIPLINQGKLSGIVYLENNLVQGAFTPNRVEMLSLLSSQLAISIENALLYERLEHKVAERTAELATANQEITALNEQLKAENVRMRAELEVSRHLQQMALPKTWELEQIQALDIAAFMEPAHEVGGDYYDVLQHQNRIKIGIGDVAGHGLESGVLMLMVQMAVRTLFTKHLHDPIEFLDILNQALYNNIQHMNFDKNLTLCLIDYQEGKVRISGQHEEVLVVRQQGQIERIDTIPLGFFIGIKAHISDLLGYQEIILNPGDGMVLYTDGITEALNQDKQAYGIEKLCTVVSQTWQGSAAQVQQAIFLDVYRHIGEQSIADDMTVLVFKRR